jgi:hypothetical protein
MSPGLQASLIRFCAISFHKLIEKLPRNVLQELVKNDILMPHGVDPFSRPDDS